MAELFIPVLHSFENENVFTGSFGNLRFKVSPKLYTPEGTKTVDFAQSTMLCEVWHGPYCYEKSDIEAEKSFPIMESGREQMRQWLLSQTEGA